MSDSTYPHLTNEAMEKARAAFTAQEKRHNFLRKAGERHYNRDQKMLDNLFFLWRRKCTIRWWPPSTLKCPGTWDIHTLDGWHVISSRSIRIVLEEGVRVIKIYEAREKKD